MSSGSSESEIVTLIYVPGQAGKIKRFNLSRGRLRRAALGGVVFCVALVALSVDYVMLRQDLTELDYLRTETREQREQLLGYADQLGDISEHLTRISQFDRKLRVITNLDPADPLPLPGIGGVDDGMLSSEALTGLTRERRHRQLTRGFESLALAASGEAESLNAVFLHLENQQARLAATPSVTPTRGWVTSGFGYRSSPFTGNREVHRGLDIAGRMGTPVISPADGVVRYAKGKRALGKAISISHGYGIETIYGHLSEWKVAPGEKVRRGQVIGLMGNTGRSTGPHLHYQVEVNGKPVNPQNYVLD
jgi:murein DD-endopeptidase MepM/ murein hydrolase activator NlpD